MKLQTHVTVNIAATMILAIGTSVPVIQINREGHSAKASVIPIDEAEGKGHAHNDLVSITGTNPCFCVSPCWSKNCP